MEASGNWKVIAGNDVIFGFIVSSPAAILGQNQTFIFYSSMQTLESEYEKCVFKMEKKVQQYSASSIGLQLI